MTKQSNHNKRLSTQNDKLQDAIRGLERKVQHQEGQISRLQGRLTCEGCDSVVSTIGAAGELIRTQKQNTQIKSSHSSLEQSYNSVATSVVTMQQVIRTSHTSNNSDG